MIVLSNFRFTRNLFLRCVCLVYIFAFASLSVQIPGLYGDNGILPAKNQLEAATESDYWDQIQKKPTLLWFARYLGLSTEYMMDILSLAGIFLAFVGFISTKACVKPLFAGLWSLYYSLYQVGQTFMWFQWDILLLETGLLCVIVSPLWQWTQKPEKAINLAARGGSKASPPPQPPPPSQAITMWLVRWLLFRLLFSSGVVKLTSGCPQWWGLTALKVHFESMCLPTPLAWYSHHLPDFVLKLTTVFAIAADIFLPFFFYVPIRLVRIWAFFIQLFLQVAIILTGNFNFFNYLVVALLISLLDDTFFNKGDKKEEKTGGSYFAMMKSFLKCIIAVALYVGLIFFTMYYFRVKHQGDGSPDVKIIFNNKDVEKMLTTGLPLIFLGGALSLALTSFVALNAVLKSIVHPSTSMISFIGSVFSTISYSIIAAAIFADSLVPLSGLAPGGNATIPEPIKEWHASLSHMHVTNSYGMMRRITGVGGRPEVIIEYATNKEGPWQEYKFRYKPGPVDGRLPWVAPHQPRLDWHMWFAALGTYHQNPWVMSLAYRLLQQEPSVLALLHEDHHVPARVGPKFVRAQLYHYHYTPKNTKTNATWTRHKLNEYFPVFTVDHPPLIEYLQKVGILAKPGKQIKKEKMDPTIREYLEIVRRFVTHTDPLLLMLSLFITGVVLILTSKGTSSSGSSTSSSGSGKQAQAKKQQPKKK